MRKIKKGDKIKVLAGKDRGKTGKVLHIIPDKKKVTVEGINLLYKNMRSRKEGEKGQRIQFPAAFALSNIMLVCPKCGKATRGGNKMQANKKKLRVCKKCKEVFE